VSQLNGMLLDASENGRAGSPVVLDVREPWEYMQGHVPSAKLISLGALGARIEELDAEKPVAVICETGIRSQVATAILGQRGFQKVYNVIGGTSGWKEAGYPLSHNGRFDQSDNSTSHDPIDRAKASR
jgi:rhodanese-related sulfurtransferase